MTTVTKIFIVLVCLFAFIFTPMAIQFAGRKDDWKALAEKYEDHAETALAHERSTIATAASTIEHYKALRDQERRRAETDEQRIAELERQIEELTQNVKELERSRDSWENSAQTLSAQMEVINTHNQELVKENKRLTQSELDLQTKLIDRTDRVEELIADMVQLRRQLMQKTEELASVRKENDQLRQMTGIGRAGEALTTTLTPSARPATPTPPTAIRGKVTAVEEAKGWASINVGSASGLAEGMTMVVIRGEDYICDLIITNNVTPTEAVGRMVRVPGGKQIRPGDVLIDLDSFNAP